MYIQRNAPCMQSLPLEVIRSITLQGRFNPSLLAKKPVGWDGKLEMIDEDNTYYFELAVLMFSDRGRDITSLPLIKTIDWRLHITFLVYRQGELTLNDDLAELNALIIFKSCGLEDIARDQASNILRHSSFNILKQVLLCDEYTSAFTKSPGLSSIVLHDLPTQMLEYLLTDECKSIIEGFADRRADFIPLQKIICSRDLYYFAIPRDKENRNIHHYGLCIEIWSRIYRHDTTYEIRRDLINAIKDRIISSSEGSQEFRLKLFAHLCKPEDIPGIGINNWTLKSILQGPQSLACKILYKSGELGDISGYLDIYMSEQCKGIYSATIIRFFTPVLATNETKYKQTIAKLTSRGAHNTVKIMEEETLNAKKLVQGIKKIYHPIAIYAHNIFSLFGHTPKDMTTINWGQINEQAIRDLLFSNHLTMTESSSLRYCHELSRLTDYAKLLGLDDDGTKTFVLRHMELLLRNSESRILEEIAQTYSRESIEKSLEGINSDIDIFRADIHLLTILSKYDVYSELLVSVHCNPHYMKDKHFDIKTYKIRRTAFKQTKLSSNKDWRTKFYTPYLQILRRSHSPAEGLHEILYLEEDEDERVYILCLMYSLDIFNKVNLSSVVDRADKAIVLLALDNIDGMNRRRYIEQSTSLLSYMDVEALKK